MTEYSAIYRYGDYLIQMHDGVWMFYVNGRWEMVYHDAYIDTSYNNEAILFAAFIRVCEIEVYLE